MAFSFGILGEIDSTAATIIFVATIFFLTGFEFLTGGLEYIVRENPIYNQMLQRIYKELMIMGFMTFVFAMYFASDKSGTFSGYITEIDFVGYITFFVALFFVAHAMYIMILSMHTTKVYDRLHNITVADLIGDYTKERESKFVDFLFKIPYLPISSLRQRVEFKVIYALFRDTFWLPSDFDYGSYLGRSFEKYSLRMININLSSWMITIVLCVLNYLRIVFGHNVAFLTCSNDNSNGNYTTLENTSTVSGISRNWDLFEGEDEYERPRRLYEEVSHDCSYMHLQIFVLCGTLIALYALILFLIGRLYLKRLIARTGVTNCGDFYKFLMLEESITLKNTQTRNIEIKIRNKTGKKIQSRGGSGRRMSINTFRSNVNNLLQEKPKNEDTSDIYKTISAKSLSSSSLVGKVVSSLKRRLSRDSSYSHSSAAIRPELLTNKADAHSTEHSLLHAPESPNKRTTLINKCKEMMQSTAEPPQRRKNIIIKLTKGDSSRGFKQEDEQILTSIEQFKLLKIKEMRKQKIERAASNQRMMMSYLRDKNSSLSANNLDMKLSEDFSDIYFFRSPELYFKMVEVAIMLNSLYLSLWACNFITLVNVHFNRSPFFHIVMLIPLLCVLPLLGEIVKVSSLLSAIADLDLDVIGAVLEISEEKKLLVNEVRDKILMRIHGRKDQDKMLILKQLFEEIDSNGNGQISKFELREMLRALSLHYSDHKFKRLYAAMDKDRSGAMDMDEFLDLVFPKLALKREVRRRAILLKKHSDAYDDSKERDLGPYYNGFKSTLAQITSSGGRGRAFSVESSFSDDDLSGRKRSNSEEFKESQRNSLQMNEQSTSKLKSHKEEGISRDCSRDYDNACDIEREDEASVHSIDHKNKDYWQSMDTAVAPMLVSSSRSPLHEKEEEKENISDDAQIQTQSREVHLSDDESVLTPRHFQTKPSSQQQQNQEQPRPLHVIDRSSHASNNKMFTAEGEATTEADTITNTDHFLLPEDQNDKMKKESEKYLDFVNKSYSSVYMNDIHDDDNDSEISALGKSVCVLDDDNKGYEGRYANSYFDDVRSYTDFDQSLTGCSYYSADDSDDNSLITAEIRGNQEESLHLPKHKRNPDLYRVHSVELQTLLHHTTERREQPDKHENLSLFCLNHRAATALHHISSQQQN